MVRNKRSGLRNRIGITGMIILAVMLGNLYSVYADLADDIPLTNADVLGVPYLPDDDSSEDKGDDPYDSTESQSSYSSTENKTIDPYDTAGVKNQSLTDNNGYYRQDSNSTGDKEQLKKQYQSEQDQSDYYREMVEDLSLEITSLNLQIMDQAGKLDESKHALIELDEKIRESEENLKDIRQRLAEDQELNHETVILMYLTRQEAKNLSGVLAHESIYYLLSREEYMHGLEDYIYERLEEQEELLQQAEEQNQILQELMEEREEEAEEYEAQMQIMEARVERLTTLMQDARQKAEDADRFAESIQQKLLELEEQEKEQLRKQVYQASSSDVSYTGNGTTYYYENPYTYTDSQLQLLAGIIEAEAGSKSYPGMVAVGSVVMNRVNNPQFSDTIEGVIYAPSQFEPASTGRLAMILAKGPEASCISAARDVLDGKRNVPNLYFKAAWYAREHGIQGINIGGNVFH